MCGFGVQDRQHACLTAVCTLHHVVSPAPPACRHDVEIEMDRFENARDATLAKYRMMQRPKGKLADGLNLAVDGIATLCMGECGPGLQPRRLVQASPIWLRRCTTRTTCFCAHCSLCTHVLLVPLLLLQALQTARPCRKVTRPC